MDLPINSLFIIYTNGYIYIEKNYLISWIIYISIYRDEINLSNLD